MFTVLQCLVHKPTWYFHEIQDQLFQATGTWIHASTVCSTVKEQGFTRKKVQPIALQQSEDKRVEYMAEVAVFNTDMLIWVLGYSSSCLSTKSGIEDVYTTKLSVDGEKFEGIFMPVLTYWLTMPAYIT